MRIFYAYSLIQISAACALAFAIYKLGPLCEEQTYDQLKQRMASSLGDDGQLTLHVKWLFNFTTTRPVDHHHHHHPHKTSTSKEGTNGPKRVHAKATTTPPPLGDSVHEEASRVPPKSNLPGKDDILKPVPSSADAAETKPPVPAEVDNSEDQVPRRVPRGSDNAKAGSLDKHRVEKKGDSASLSVPPNAFSQYKICVEVVQQESAPEDDPMNVLVSRMNYCFFALVAAAIMGTVHMSLRAANSMPLSEFADCVLLVMCGAGWAFVLVMVGIVHYGWSDSWKDFGIVPSVPCTFAATETVAVLVLLILIFDFVSIKVSYMNVSLRESRPYQRTSGGTDRSVYQPTTE